MLRSRRGRDMVELKTVGAVVVELFAFICGAVLVVVIFLFLILMKSKVFLEVVMMWVYDECYDHMADTSFGSSGYGDKEVEEKAEDGTKGWW